MELTSELNKGLFSKYKDQSPIQNFTNFQTGDKVRIIEGDFSGGIGSIISLDHQRQKIKVSISIFSRETHVEYDFNQIEFFTSIDDSSFSCRKPRRCKKTKPFVEQLIEAALLKPKP